MRTFIFTIFILCSTLVLGQDFEYEYRINFVEVTATGETFSKTGKRQTEHIGFSLDSDYWVSTILCKHRTYLTEEQLEILKESRPNLVAKMIITYKGDIESVTFLIRNEFFSSIPEDVIRKLYNDYRNTKIDVSKGHFDPPLDENTYALIHFPLR